MYGDSKLVEVRDRKMDFGRDVMIQEERDDFVVSERKGRSSRNSVKISSSPPSFFSIPPTRLNLIVDLSN